MEKVMWKRIAILLLLLCIALLIALIVVATKDSSEIGKPKFSQEIKVCGEETNTPKITTSQGLFDDLTPAEIQNVHDYMTSILPLNLKPNKDVKLNTNTIAMIKFYPPAKDKALAYLDQGKEKPERQALVVVFMGALQPPKVEEYLVGPVSAPSKHELLKIDGRTYPINFNQRPTISPQEVATFHTEIFLPMGKKLDRLFKESYDGYSVINCGNKCLNYQFGSPYGLTSDVRETWYMLMRNEVAFYSHPLNFEFYVNQHGSNSSKWRIEKLLYNGQLFNSIDELLDAYDKGKLVKTFISAPKGDDKLFSTYERRGKKQPVEPSRGPEQYEPDGKRYSVKGKHVEYMDWAFDFRVDSVSGFQVFDVRFSGERIAYEISLQEAMATYGGYYPTQMSINFADSAYAMGHNAHDLVQGVDCPGTATYFDLVHMVYSDKPVIVKNGACVFELNTGIPLRRHYDSDFQGGYTFYGGMVNQALVLRTINSVGNYDYIHDLIFYQNGAIQVKVSASGFTFGTFYDENVSPYGYPLHNNLTSAIHDHLINYRVDLDVGGRENSYETIEVQTENVTDRWLPEKRRYIVKKVLKRSAMKTEQEAAYKYNFDHPKYLNFYNENKKNRFGTSKGYRIQLNGVLKQVYPEDWVMVSMMRWSLYQLAVTKYKESERQSSSQYNQNSPSDPHVDFGKFLEDNEPIVNEDIVAWLTLGLLHIPHSEDVPNTATVGSTAGFYLRPFNYFDEDPSIGSTNAILIKPTDNKYTPSFQRFGTPTGPKCLPKDYSVTFDGRY